MSPTTRRPVAELVLAAVLAAMAGLAWSGLLPWRSLAGPVFVAAAASTLLAVVAVRRRGGAIADLAISAIGFVVVAGLVLYRPTTWFGLPTLATARAVGDGLVNGVARTLATSVPAPPLASIRLVPFTGAWLAGFWGATLTDRSRSLLTPLLGAVATLVVGILMSSGGSSLLGVTAVFVATAVLYVVVRVARLGGMDRRSLGRRSIRAGLPLMAVVALVALGVAAAISFSSPPYDLHDAASTRADPRAALTPLRQIQARLSAPRPIPMFDVRVTEGTGAVLPNMRLAVLDRFDGSQWSSTETFVPVGTVLSPVSTSIASSQTISMDVTVRDLDGFWLPTLATPVRTTLTDIDAGGVSRSLTTPKASVAGMRYSQTSEVLDPTLLQLHNAQVATGDAAATDLPDGAEADLASIRAAAQAAAGGVTTPYGQLLALQHYLESPPFRATTDAPAGQSYARIRQLLDGDHAGTSEQFASAFAVMARTLGIPTRVVAGFRHAAVKNGTVSVTSADADAWTEVDLAGIGWVPFESTPAAGQQPPPETPPTTTAANTAPGNETAATGAAPGSASRPGGATGVSGRDWPALVESLALAVVVLLCVVWPIVVVSVRSRRRRRLRRDPSPRVSALGAWRYALEPLTPPEGRALSTLTVAEVDDLVAERFGESLRAELVGVGSVANRARFDPSGVEPEDASLAWSRATTFHEGADRQRRWWERISSAFGPRALRRP